MLFLIDKNFQPNGCGFSNQKFYLLNLASDSGFDSKDEGASAATPTKDPPPPSANLSLPPNPDLNLPPSNPPVVAAERPSGGGEDSSSPEVGSGEMSRRAAIRQPVLRKRRMNFN